MNKDIKKQALLFIVFLGIISFFSDFTHEGARSIYGQYLNIIGVSAFLVAFTAGLGEFIGQALRIFTGWIADKTKKYWVMMILGYAINLLAIPLLALVNESIWQIALVLIVLERVGKAIRAPAKSALTSFTAPHLGAGKAFAINEALDQLGAFLGPLLVFFILNASSLEPLPTYQISFAILGIFAIATLILLGIAKAKYPTPDSFEIKKDKVTFKSNRAFILYMVAISFIAFGFIDYPVIAYHLDSVAAIPVVYIPLLYSLAMGVDAIAALIFGHLFDKYGVAALIGALAIALFSTPVLFLLPGSVAIIVGMMLWGVGMGAQESILKAVVAKIIPKERRATGYGIFSSVFGLAWFLGSLIVGALYGFNITMMVIFAMTMEVISIILLIVFIKTQHQFKEELIKG